MKVGEIAAIITSIAGIVTIGVLFHQYRFNKMQMEKFKKDNPV